MEVRVVEEKKFIRLFGRSEIYLTACAVSKSPDLGNRRLAAIKNICGPLIVRPNQFWHRHPHHEKALVKVYKNNPHENAICYDSTQIIRIRMPFLGDNAANGWGELQFLIKELKLVNLARHRSFDARINKWAPETRLIQPKTDLETHAYLSLRFYHQDHRPPIPGDWHWEPVYVSIASIGSRSFYYKIDVLWQKEEIKIVVTILDKDSPEIPKNLLK